MKARMSSELKDDLQTLIESPGWKAFEAHLLAEWGAGGKRFEQTVDRFADSREEDRFVLEQIRQIAVARREILRLVQWPVEEIARLKHLDQETDGSLRRPLAPELVGQSRRGSL